MSKKHINHGANLAILVKLDKRTAEEIASKMKTTRNNLYVWMRTKTLTPTQLSKVSLAGYNLEDITGEKAISGLIPPPAQSSAKIESKVKSLEEVVAEMEEDLRAVNAKLNKLASDYSKIARDYKEVIKENQKLQGALEYAGRKGK